MQKSRFLLATALASSSLVMLAQPVWAQAAKPAEAGAENDVIVVTGSRIARRDLESSSPVSVVSGDEFRLSGTVNVEGVLNTLPQTYGSFGSSSNNPGDGTAQVDLRGFGSQRALVLVNGRRYIFFDTSQVVDLNTIPQFLIDSVDVVTGGASAVYGSDAISGVVNFRFRNIKGLELGSEYSITSKGDGARYQGHVALGGEIADGRGHFTAFAEYYKRKPIFQNARSFSRTPLADDIDGVAKFLGNRTTPAGRFTILSSAVVGDDPDGDGPQSAPTLPRGVGSFGSTLGATFDAPGGASRAFKSPDDGFNLASTNYLQLPQQRYLIGAFGDYDIKDGLTAFTEIQFINNRTSTQLAPTPFTGTFDYDIVSNPGRLSAADIATLQQVDANEAAIQAARAANGLSDLGLPDAGLVRISFARRFAEVGGRLSENDRNAFRIVGGLRGQITDKIGFEAYYSYARTRNSNVQSGNISRSAVLAGIDDGTVNIFGPGSLTPAAVQAISIRAQNADISQLKVASGSINGSLFNLGLGGEDVGFAVGAEYRSQRSRFIPDTALASGDVAGFNAAQPTAGGYRADEVFGELRVPIAADKPLVQRLELNGAVRYSDYSLKAVGGVTTYAGGIEYAPLRDITFRGNYQRAIRAPNVGELFGGQTQDFAQATDPCADPSAASDATLRNLCIATGVPASQVGAGAALQPNTQIEGLAGGNPNLQEERSDSYTAGIVLRPSFIPRLTITADYYNIKIKSAIAAAGGGVGGILDLCYNQFKDANNPFCKLIKRDPATGIIGTAPNIVSELNANLSAFKSNGIDFQADYTLPLNFGVFSESSKLNLNFSGNYDRRFIIQQVVGRPGFNCAGRFGNNVCGNPYPKFKSTTRLTYLDGPVTTSFRWRHMSSVRDDDDNTDYAVERIGRDDLFDISFDIKIKESFDLSVGVNNITDHTPDQLGSNQDGANTFPQTYDVLGRDFFISGTLKF